MTRVSFLLLVATVVSALWLVHSHYESRRIFMDMESARKEAKRIEVDHDRMEVERRAQATPLRVEQIARQQLNMRTASPAITQYVNAQGAAIGASLPAVGGGQ
ncbi:cell division protein FtsL [Limnohabitans sp. Rim8]|jgi:cell division protein FtsL|uniref:cell division protein FtsL n=1 Tax=Limnohabitans sp. Rim8 TaxID=1100718 RepID=UPI0025E4E986|nr:cell division protein FtsL [Limnohabitans sp. Rim8]